MSYQVELTERVLALEKKLKDMERRDQYGVWTDYSSTSTVTGWSAFTTKHVYYMRVGKLMKVAFNIIGTSDDTVATFTLPYTSAANPNIRFLIRITDNGGTPAEAIAYLAGGASTVTCYASMNAGAFTSSGDKYVQGQFFYAVA